MSRTTNALNRAVLLAVGLLLLVGGAATTAWGSGRWQIGSGVVDTSSVTKVIEEAWWPWASAAAGVLAIALALRWVSALLLRSPVRTVGLPGSGAQGRLTVHAAALARLASELLGSTLGVRSTQGRCVRHRRWLVLELTATVEPTTNLDALASAYAQVSTELSEALERGDVQARLLLHSASRSRKLSRVD